MNYFGKIKVSGDYIGGFAVNDVYSSCIQIFSKRIEPLFFYNHCKRNVRKVFKKNAFKFEQA